MSVLNSRQLHNLMEAVRLIHSHGHGAFHERLIQALDLVYESSHHAFEIYGQDGSYSMETNVPFDEARKTEILQRTAELVPIHNPMFHRMADGETQPMRLSDFITVRQLRRTDLYQDIFRDVDVTRQVCIPVQSPECLGGITINRGGKDYTEEDLCLAALLTPQIAAAFEADALIRRLTPARQRLASVDFTRLRRLGFTRRECEVFCWMYEGKRDGEIAIILKISPRTVNHHVRAILGKLGVETRTAAVTMVLQLGLLPPPGGN